MRQYETKMVEVERINCVNITCDICRMVREGTDQWESSYYEINETTIEITVHQKKGSNFPDGGSGDEVVIDICPECFKNKLIPWVESYGTKIERKNWDW